MVNLGKKLLKKNSSRAQRAPAIFKNFKLYFYRTYAIVILSGSQKTYFTPMTFSKTEFS